MTETYTARQTGRKWPIYTGVYYDCHVVSIPQVLGPKLFQEWMAIVSTPTIKSGWQGMYCRQRLDSEIARDEVLFGTFGVKKTFVDISGALTETIEANVKKHGYLICRVDSYYHPHFHNDYKTNHSPGHKVTVIDFDADTFTILDNNGTHTTVLTLDRAEMIDSVLSNLYYAYDKEDTFYRFDPPDAEEAERLRPGIDKEIRRTLDGFVKNRADVAPGVAALQVFFPEILRNGEPLRAYSALRHVYKTALTVEFCYNALRETRPTVQSHWDALLPGDQEAIFKALSDAATGWKFLKMQCKTAEVEDKAAEYAPRMEKALDAIQTREARLADLMGVTPKPQEKTEGPRNWKTQLFETKLLKSLLG